MKYRIRQNRNGFYYVQFKTLGLYLGREIIDTIDHERHYFATYQEAAAAALKFTQ